jgi:hypothetical protein
MKRIRLLVDTEALSKYTTMLQSGIYVEVDQGTTIGELLFSLPGFSEEYVKTRVETIFLNGLPADNLQQQLFGKKAVIAISAAMPGLAGAIFRKDGIHASLRTTTAGKLSSVNAPEAPITIRLKLFNMISKDRGEQLFSNSCVVSAKSLIQFLGYRLPLAAAIQKTYIDDIIIDTEKLQDNLLTEKMIQLTIRDSYDN